MRQQKQQYFFHHVLQQCWDRLKLLKNKSFPDRANCSRMLLLYVGTALQFIADERSHYLRYSYISIDQTTAKWVANYHYCLMKLNSPKISQPFFFFLIYIYIFFFFAFCDEIIVFTSVIIRNAFLVLLSHYIYST